MSQTKTPSIVITPRGLASVAEWRELWAARDLCWFLVRRDLKTRYVQSVLGLGWAVVQPVFTTGVLTLIFGKLAGMYSDGVPYAIWSLAGVVSWTFFQTAVSDTGNCLAANLNVVSKVYFPRLVLPLAAVAGKVFDLLIMLALLAIVMVATHGQLLLAGCHLQLAALWVLPMAMLITIIAALAGGLWLAALSVQYRDVRVAQTLLLQLLMYASPIIYSSTKIYSQDVVPAPWRELYFLNPIAGVVEATRAVLFGPDKVPLSYEHLALGAAVAVLGLLGGIWCFRRAENLVADVA